MFEPIFQRTQTERAGDSTRPFQFDRSEEHKDRVIAHCKRVQRDYFDSGLFYAEMHAAEGGGING